MDVRNGTRLAGSVLFLITATGCSSDPCQRGGPLTLATFNAGLAAADVENTTERARPVSELLAAQDLELLCVQEYWDENHWQLLAEQTAGTLPNTVRLPPLSECASGCIGSETEPLAECAAEPCAGLTGTAYLGCADENCNAQEALSAGCIGCLISEASVDETATPDQLQERCATPPDGTAPSYLFDCSYDTGILTRNAVLEQESRPLDSFMVLSAVSFARVESGSGEVDVYCAHLQSEMAFPYQGDFGSYEAEQAHQLEQLLAFIAERDDGSRPVVLMGDLNTGPAMAEHDIEGVWPEHYQQLIAAGFTEPYATQPDVSCTYCPENTFQSDSHSAELIDHILVRNASADLTVSPFMTDTMSIEVAGDPVETHPSDHFGLKATVEPWCAD